MKTNASFFILGILTLSIIVDNYILAPVTGSPVRYWLSSWTYPVLIAVTGYMLNMQELGKAKYNMSNVFRLFWRNGMRDFTIAWMAYSLLDIASQDSTAYMSKYSVQSILLHIIYPYSHLWLILSVTIMGLINIMLYRRGVRKWSLFVVNTTLGLVLECFNAVLMSHPVLPYVTRLPFFVNGGLIMFYGIGVACRENLFAFTNSVVRFKAVIPCVIVCVCWTLLAVSQGALGSEPQLYWRYILSYPVLAVMLIWGICPIMYNNYVPGRYLNTIQFIGNSQRTIYIWHLLPLIAMQIIKNEIAFDDSTHYLVFLLMFVSFIVIFWQINVRRRKETNTI